MLLDPGMDLTLRPMRYPHFYDRFRDAIKNTWTVEEVDLHSDLKDLARLSPAEQHLVSRLVAFFATGDTIVANNLVLNLYQHVNAPEARLYLSRQLFEEAVHSPDGNFRSPTFVDYTIVSAPELKTEPRLIHAETASVHNPEGFRGVGEAGTIAVPAAIANAVEDALYGLGLKVCVDEIPITPERLWRLGSRDLPG